MRFQGNPVKIGIGIFLLILLSVIAVLAGFWDALTPRGRATVTIGGVGALGTAALALATFWTIKQNEETLKGLEKERRKPVVLDMLSEVIDPIIEKTETNKNKLSRSQRVWKRDNRDNIRGQVNVLRPPSYQSIEVSTWHEFKENYPDLHAKCRRWWVLVNELEKAAEELAERLYEADEYEGISDRDLAVKTIMNATQYSAVDDEEEYRRMMYQNYLEEHHQYWRAQWNLLKLIQKLRSDNIEMKRKLQEEYGISNREIAEHQEVS